jgi:hypothetical protein
MNQKQALQCPPPCVVVAEWTCIWMDMIAATAHFLCGCPALCPSTPSLLPMPVLPLVTDSATIMDNMDGLHCLSSRVPPLCAPSSYVGSALPPSPAEPKCLVWLMQPTWSAMTRSPFLVWASLQPLNCRFKMEYVISIVIVAHAAES